MVVIGITGGIGSGKSTISNMLREQGYYVFDTDVESKRICNIDTDVINNIKEIFGEDIYINNKLDRKKLSNIVFNNKELLDKLSSIIHPKTREYMFGSIIKNLGSEFYFVESAIMFETDLNKLMDYIICVTAPENIRIKRVIKRDNTTKDKVLNRIKNQLDEKDRLKKSDYIISTNQSIENIKEKLFRLIEDIKYNI